ncbi:unnamed protein product [Zymoseptoria tritici ST99CH_3D1]|uniref:RTA1 domain protein n=1 Tax=Zymoseptoria tritici (strain ST99CH_3D7) TaxID=1276538 RepID=A0A1X7RZW2_ZYMT9|nr:unnamed protein product [Zymoseptoria tritici ST99CH_3D7]SMR58179.1 unnamed protein product [Zymoseptoria tritici ST99CH_3D1]
MANGIPVKGSIYIYAPNKGAPVFFAIAFAVSFAFHVYQCHRYKAWKMIGLQPLCALLFTLGYAMREWNAFNYIYVDKTTSSNVLLVYILSQVFVYIAPPLLELANYHVLGRILHYVPWLSPLRPSLITSLFGGIMLVVEILNSVGVSLSANPSATKATQNLGAILTKVAIALQLAILLAFLALAASFHLRCHRHAVPNKRIKTPLLTLYCSTALILIRCIYRLVEHLGQTRVDFRDQEALRALSPLLRYEFWFYIFEATLMLLNSVLWNVFHPGRFLPAEQNVFVGRDGEETVDEVEVGDDRGVLKKTMHVLTFGVLFGRKSGARQELETETRSK